MKHFAALILLFVASYARADCQDSWLEYRSSKLQMSVRYSEGCYHGKLILEYSKPSKNGSQGSSPSSPVQSIPFDRECQTTRKNKEGVTIEFSCRSDGTSPLAGASYRFKLIKTTMECDGIESPDWDHTFICIKGCKPTTPKRLEVPFGEGCA